jgi:Recombinase/Recombinase zinc beta ribbon domain
MMVLRFVRANEESALKSARVAAARERQRQKFASREPLTEAYTRQLPGWLRWNDDAKAIEIIPERAAIVRRMFELADIGWGQHRIAAWLNETTGEPWGRGKRKGTRWHRSYVRKVLTNPAVVGTFTPHTVERDPETRRKLRKPLDAIHHRFPAVVDRELFERVSSRIGSTAPRGRHARTEVRSIFSGVLKCRHCGGTVTRVSKGEYVYLVCSAANSSPRTCQYEALPYNEIEEAFIHGISRTIEEAPAVRLDQLRIADQVFQWRRIGYDIEASTDHVLGLARALVNNGKPLEPICLTYWGALLRHRRAPPHRCLSLGEMVASDTGRKLRRHRRRGAYRGIG